MEPFDLTSVVREVAEWQEGHVVSTLDVGCNNRASDWGYVKEYRRWFGLFVDQARAVVRSTGADPLRGDRLVELDLPHDVQPARFVRRVLGMFLAVQETEHLFAEHPVLSSLIGPDPSVPLQRLQEGLDITPLHLYLSVCNSNWVYCDRPMMSVRVGGHEPRSALWTPKPSVSQIDDVLLLSLAPFNFVLTTRVAIDLGHDISEWAKWCFDARPNKSQRRLTLPTADMLGSVLRGLVYPRDYRVR